MSGQVVLVVKARINDQGQVWSTEVAREWDGREGPPPPVDQAAIRLWWSILEQASLEVGRRFERRGCGNAPAPDPKVCASCGHPDALTHGLWRVDRFGVKHEVSPSVVQRHCVLLRIVKLLESGALRQGITLNLAGDEKKSAPKPYLPIGPDGQL